MVASQGIFYILYPVEQSEQSTEKHIHTELARFSNYLKQSGLKITQQRLLVAEKIFRLNTHFSVESLTNMLVNEEENISRATIYRIVSILLESGQISEHRLGANIKYYEHIPQHQHHDHIVCSDCGLIDEFTDNEIEKLQHQIAERLGFDLNDHSLNLYGNCLELKKTGSCKRAAEKK